MEVIFSLDQIQQVAQEVLKNAEHKIILFQAPMGSGKTTLIKQLAKELNIIDLTSSPTFSIVNQYQSKDNKNTVYHFDLYRIEDEEQAYDMGMEEYLDSGDYCFIEWPENTPNIIPLEHTLVQIEILPDSKRKLNLINK
ncbi:tRNA (adenosine(37)-N6)-threonylcarbamoyltransferase complex ATPase subunit type 1 TsaE [Myroides sp. LJL119]